jgi:hypothetical protein
MHKPTTSHERRSPGDAARCGRPTPSFLAVVVPFCEEANPSPVPGMARTRRRCGLHEEQRLDAEFPGVGLGGRARRCCWDPLPPRTHADSREPAPLSSRARALPPPDQHKELTGTTLGSSLLGSRGRGHLGGLDEDLHDVTCREKKSSARELPLAAEVKVAF